jgi:glutamate N-acetyltransferase/amino-acid N-acetyltransferase
MEAGIEFIPAGSVTSPEGFFAGAVSAGIGKNTTDKLDLAVLFSQKPSAAAAVFTTARIKAASVVTAQKKLKRGQALAVAVNSGCANAFTGEDGVKDALEMAEITAGRLNVPPKEVLAFSTGVIGVRLPMKKISAGIARITFSRGGGHDFAGAIMTTDTVSKGAAVRVSAGSDVFTIGGAVKGSGMIHPDMATLLCFLTTDATVEKGFLKKSLKKAVDLSFNMVSIDGDTSPNDTALLMANGMAKSEPVSAGSKLSAAFQQALNELCIYLAKRVAADGEGATRLIEVKVSGAASANEARLAAKAIVSSSLVKTAVHGADPNWGRIKAAVGRSGVKVKESKIDLGIGDVAILKAGKLLPFSEKEVVKKLKSGEVLIEVNLNLGSGVATAWGCDLSAEYVEINSRYTT